MKNRNVFVKKDCHCRMSLSGIPTFEKPSGGDPQLQTSGMTSLFDNGLTTHAFTLIELLVVVLIIGILAAVALPQYQKAVIKSRYAKLKVLAASVFQAQELYYLTHGDYATDIDDLDIVFPDSTVTPQNIAADEQKYTRFYEWGKCYTYGPDYSVVCRNEIMGYYMYFKNKPNSYANRRLCVAYTTDRNSIEAQICQSETGNTGAEHSARLNYLYP